MCRYKGNAYGPLGGMGGVDGQATRLTMTVGSYGALSLSNSSGAFVSFAVESAPTLSSTSSCEAVKEEGRHNTRRRFRGAAALGNSAIFE